MPDTKEIVYLRKRKSDRKSQNNRHGLMEALERASNIRQKAFNETTTPQNDSASASDQDSKK